MLCVVCCALVGVCVVRLRCPLCVVRCVMFVVYCCIGCCCWFGLCVWRSLFVLCCLLFDVGCLPFLDSCVLIVLCGLSLCLVGCLLFKVVCRL